MSVGSMRTLTVLFQTPEGEDPAHHERVFEEVPNSVAERMAEDFAAARDPGSDTSPYQLYRYEENGTERLVALDYTEVKRGRAHRRRRRDAERAFPVGRLTQ